MTAKGFELIPATRYFTRTFAVVAQWQFKLDWIYELEHSYSLSFDLCML